MLNTNTIIFLLICSIILGFFIGQSLVRLSRKKPAIRTKAEVLLDVLKLNVYDNICDAYTKIYREPYFSSDLYKEMVLFCKKNNINGVLFKLRKDDSIALLNKMIKSSWER